MKHKVRGCTRTHTHTKRRISRRELFRRTDEEDTANTEGAERNLVRSLHTLIVVELHLLAITLYSAKLSGHSSLTRLKIYLDLVLGQRRAVSHRIQLGRVLLILTLGRGCPHLLDVLLPR